MIELAHSNSARVKGRWCYLYRAIDSDVLQLSKSGRRAIGRVDRLTRALSDFARLIEIFDRHAVSFISVTQPFNTTTSMGRLTLHVLLSFAQFEREVTGERIRDKIAASKQKGLWMGGQAASRSRRWRCSRPRPRTSLRPRESHPRVIPD